MGVYCLRGQEAFVVRAGRKMQSDDLMTVRFSGTPLKLGIDRIPLWRGYHVHVKQLAEDFARYPYQQRLTGPDVFEAAINDGLGLLLWHQDAFGYVGSFDENTRCYLGLRGGSPTSVRWEEGQVLVVKGEVTAKQMETDSATTTSFSGQREHENAANHMRRGTDLSFRNCYNAVSSVNPCTTSKASKELSWNRFAQR